MLTAKGPNKFVFLFFFSNDGLTSEDETLCQKTPLQRSVSLKKVRRLATLCERGPSYVPPLMMPYF